MDELHLRKIDLADEIFVVDFNGYIGESTANEIEYAKRHGKVVRYFSHDLIGNAVLSLSCGLKEATDEP
jgi:bifunctional DNase/RNase